MAQTTNKNVILADNSKYNYETLPVSASQTIYQNQLVAVDSSGYARPASDAATQTFVGVAKSKADNSTGANAAAYVEVITNGLVLLATTGSTPIASNVYCNSDELVAVSVALATTGVSVGKVSAKTSPTSGYVWVDLNASKTGYTSGF